MKLDKTFGIKLISNIYSITQNMLAIFIISIIKLKTNSQNIFTFYFQICGHFMISF